MYCKYCGQPLDERAVICPHCGVATDNAPRKMTAEGDAPSAGFAVLSFFFPVVGLILYLVWHDDYPQKARSCGKGALISVIVNAAFVLIYILFVACMVGTFIVSTASVGVPAV